jgi:hypothetical protein
MRRKGSFSCLFPSAPVASSKLNAPSPAASRSSMSLPLPLSPTASPRECEISETSSEASALDRAVAAVLLSPSGSSTLRRSSLQPAVDSDTMQGYMVIHTKKPKRKKLFTLNRSYYVVADAEQPVLEAFTSEARTERVYLFSLAGAHVDFEADDVSHAVRAKCFCLNVQSYLKRGIDYAQPQGFVFYQENQAQMMYWVKCIHVAIRRANAIAKESVRHSNASSTVGADESETAESERAADMADTDRDESERESPAATALSSPRFAFPTPTDTTSLSVSTGVDAVPPRSPRRLRGQNRRRAAVDSIDTTAMAPPAASTTRASQKPPHFARLNTMLATMKHASHSSTASEDDKGEALQSPAASTKAKHGPAFSPPSGLMSGLHMPRGKSSSTRQVTGVVSPTSAAGKRLSDPFQFRKKDDTLFGGFFLPRGPRSAPKQTATKTTPSKEATRKGSTAEVAPLASDTEENGSCTPDEEPLEWRLSNHAARLAFLLVVSVGGILQLSVFLPLAAAGVFVYVNDHHADVFATAGVAACAVYTASGVQASLGLCSIAAIVYGWSYSDFRATLWRRRRRLAERLLEEENANFAHIQVDAYAWDPITRETNSFVCCIPQFPNWAVRPDIDRVVWLNKVLVTYAMRRAELLVLY